MELLPVPPFSLPTMISIGRPFRMCEVSILEASAVLIKSCVWFFHPPCAAYLALRSASRLSLPIKQPAGLLYCAISSQPVPGPYLTSDVAVEDLPLSPALDLALVDKLTLLSSEPVSYLTSDPCGKHVVFDVRYRCWPCPSFQCDPCGSAEMRTLYRISHVHPHPSPAARSPTSLS